MSIGPNTAIQPRSLRVEGDTSKPKGHAYYGGKVSAYRELKGVSGYPRDMIDACFEAAVRDSRDIAYKNLIAERDKYKARCIEVEKAISEFKPGWVVCPHSCCISMDGLCHNKMKQDRSVAPL
jgi:hypothetical protein